MANKPLISIITVTLNSENTLKNTMESVLNQTYDNIEYIIIDGKSTDNTLNIIKEYEKKFVNFVWLSECDKGIYDAINKGIALSNGVLIGILNSDDYLLRDSVKKVVDNYLSNFSTDVFHGNCRIIDEKRQISYIKKPLNLAQKFNSMPINHPGSFIKKECYDNIGYYSTSFSIASDYEMILRLIYYNKKFFYIDSVLSVMREGGVSFTQFKKSFQEAKAIKCIYGCSVFKAYYRYIGSLTKAYFYNLMINKKVLNKMAMIYKNYLRSHIRNRQGWG